MANSTHEGILAVIFGTLVCVSFLALLIRFTCNFPEVAAAFKWACACATRGCRPAEPHDALWHLVCQELLTRKVRQYRCLMNLFSFLTLLVTFNIFWNIIRQQQRWHTLPQDAAIIAASLLSVLPCIKPNLITTFTLDAHYVSIMACLVVYVSPFSVQGKTANLIPSLLATNACMAVLNITRRTMATRRTPAFLLMNICFVASASGSILAHGGVNFSNVPEAAMMQAVVVGLLAFGAHSLEASFAATLRQGLQFEEVKEIHGAACALLRSFCECTVELDSDGVISGPSQDLGSFLMKGSFSYSLTGKRLADLLDEADRDLFEERLRSPRMRRVGLAEALPVSARDGCGNSLRLELFWFEFKKVGGSRSFMVGVRELTDCQSPLADVNPGALPGSTGTEEEPSVTSNDLGAAILVVNAMEEGFPIQGQSSGFVAQVGKLPPRALFADFVKRPERVLAWVQRAALEERPARLEVTLLLPWGKCKARCCVVTGSDEDCGLESLGLHFTHIASVEKRRPGQGRGTPSTASSRTTSL